MFHRSNGKDVANARGVDLGQVLVAMQVIELSIKLWMALLPRWLEVPSCSFRLPALLRLGRRGKGQYSLHLGSPTRPSFPL